MSQTFLQLEPQYCNPQTAKFRILSVPYEGTVSFMPGASKGPAAILDVSNQVEHIDELLQVEFYQPGIVTLPPLSLSNDPPEVMRQIYEAAKPLFEPGKFPITLGGEHSITAPIVRAAAEVYPHLSVLQFDAHADLRDSFTPGGKYSHASVMRRVLETTPHCTQVGIRSYSKKELQECPEQIANLITVPMLESDEKLHASIETILNRLTEHVYITFDIDAFDPAFAPATGTPEPGGMTWRQATTILHAVSKAKNVIGADIVEVAPYQNGNIITEFLAARLAAKIMAFNG